MTGGGLVADRGYASLRPFKNRCLSVEIVPMPRHFCLRCLRSLMLLLVLGVSPASQGFQQVFQASMAQSRWQIDASRKRCVLSQEIPRFGFARFSQVSGRRLQFELQVHLPPVAGQSARLLSRAPPWQYGTADRTLGRVDFGQGRTPLRLPRDQALRVYYELEQGRMPTLVFDDWADGHDTVEVRLSPVRFREVLADFTVCTSHLLYLDFEPLSESTVYFSTNSTALKRAARRALQQVVRAYRKKPGLRIILGGHADERGGDDFNMNLSRRRAAFVARYLASRGVPRHAIEERYFGESQPAETASNKMAWSKNRRVTVWLAER